MCEKNPGELDIMFECAYSFRRERRKKLIWLKINTSIVETVSAITT